MVLRTRSKCSLATWLDHSTKGEVKIDVIKHVEDMIKDFPEAINKSASATASDKLFNAHGSPVLDANMKEQFLHFVARASLVAKRARPDVQPVTSFSCTRVQQPTEEDWMKLA